MLPLPALQHLLPSPQASASSAFAFGIEIFSWTVDGVP
jgi:hypothetical protein